VKIEVKKSSELKYQRNSSEIIGVIWGQFCGHQIIFPIFDQEKITQWNV